MHTVKEIKTTHPPAARSFVRSCSSSCCAGPHIFLSGASHTCVVRATFCCFFYNGNVCNVFVQLMRHDPSDLLSEASTNQSIQLSSFRISRGEMGCSVAPTGQSRSIDNRIGWILHQMIKKTLAWWRMTRVCSMSKT